MIELPSYNSLPIKDDLYTEIQSDLPELQKPWEFSTQVGQGQMRIIEETALPLFSDGFSYCHARIMYNFNNRRIALIHVEPQLRFYHQIKEELENLGPGKKKAISICGTLSGTSPDIDNLMEMFNIVNWGEIRFESGKPHWAICYKPITNKILVLQRNLGRLLTFEGFH